VQAEDRVMISPLSTQVSRENEFVHPKARLDRIVIQLALLASGVTVLAFVGFAALVGTFLPYHVWDAMSYGYWSREIADTGYFHFHFADLNDTFYQRPLFYVLQGWIWRTAGFHVSAGRLLALAFTILLIVSVAAIARRTSLGWFGAALAALVCISIADVQQYSVAGLTDMPAAAMVAFTALLLWRRQTRATAIGLAITSGLTTLSKSTALIALAGLAAGMLLEPGSPLRTRLVRTAPLVFGASAGLAYFAYEAARLHEPFLQFMRSGSIGYFGELARAARGDALLRMDVLGVDLRILLWFAVLYASLRIIRMRHPQAALAAAGLAVATSWALPALSEGGSSLGPFAGGLDRHAVVFVALAALLPLAAFARNTVPDIVVLARLLLWGIPITVTWLISAAYTTRYTSPAWPALVLLITFALGLVAEGAWRLVPALAAAPVAVLIVVAALGFPHIDAGLSGSITKPRSRSVWDAFWDAGPSGWRDAEKMRALATGPLDEEVKAVSAHLGPDDGTVISSDDRLPFFFGRRVVSSYPAQCSQLRGHRVFVLLLDRDTATQMERQHPHSSKPGFWESCRSPSLVAVREAVGSFVAYVTEPQSESARSEPRPPPG
jgi:hypothetical protein